MKKIKIATGIVQVAFCALVPSVVLAEGRLTAALGVGTGTEFYSGQDAEIGAFPYIAYDTKRFHIGLGGVQYHAIQDDAFQLSFGLAPRGAPDFPDKRLFTGIDRDTTAEATITGTYQFDGTMRTSTTFRHDVLSKHDGYEFEFMMARSGKLGPANVDVSLGARHRDENLNAYIAGVSNAEANSNRSTYAPGATTSPFAAVSLTIPVHTSIVIIGSVNFEYFGDAYSASPLVENGYTTSMGIGVAYTF